MNEFLIAQSFGNIDEAGIGIVESNSSLLFYIFLAFCLIISIVFILSLLKKTRISKYIERSYSMKLIEVRVPQSNEVEISAMDQVFASLSGMFRSKGLSKYFKPDDFISFEIASFPDSIRFYVCVPKHLKTLIEKQIHASYPTADIQDADEYNIFEENGFVAFEEMVQSTDKYKPLRTYEDFNVDILSGITTAMSKLSNGEGAALQIIVTPSNNNWREQGKSYVANLRNKAGEDQKKVSLPEDVFSAIDKKCSKVGFKTDIRIVAVSTSEQSARTIVSNIISVFDALRNQQGNSLKTRKLKPDHKKEFVKNFIYRIPSSKNILNTEELATIYHFPNKNIKTPHIHWLLAKRAPAPQEIPTQGLWIGKSIYRGVERDVAIKNEDRRQHMYIVGKTGVGKSFFEQGMIWQDIKNGQGVAFLDPHGDSAEWLLERIPPERVEDVIYFNPADTERPMGLNIIEYQNEQDKHRICNSFLNLMYKMFDPNRQGIVGPIFERAVRNAMLTAMSEEGNTLVEVLRILTDPEYVKKKMPFIKDDLVRRYWTDEIARTSDFHKSEVLGYIVSKFDRFVTNKLMRNIIGQSKSSFDLRKIMDEGKILIVNLSKGLIGEENSQFLGLLLIPKILSAAMSRADTPVDQRRDFFLYVDEFQNFATDNFAQILSEARKYRLNLIVANQYIAQIDEKIREAVFGNVGTIVSFKVGVGDAQFLQNEFAPVFDQNDLINLESINAYVKMVVDGETPPPFSIYTHLKNMPYKLPDPDIEIAKAIIDLSRLKYGRDVALVENEISQRAELAETKKTNFEGFPSGRFGGLGPM